MIIKPRTQPKILQAEEALLRRLLKTHPKWHLVEKDYGNRLAGYNGEKAVDYYIDLMPDDKFYIFRGLRLPYRNTFFQIDSLLLSPTFALLIETKNYAGTLYFNPYTEQLIRTFNQKIEAFENPLAQVKRQQMQFRQWLDDHNLPDIPLEHLVAISNSSTILQTEKGNEHIFREISHGWGIVPKIELMEIIHQKNKLTRNKTMELVQMLSQADTPHEPEVLKNFDLALQDVQTGVQCPECKTIPMRQLKGKWHCAKCRFQSKDAHIQAIQDYFLILQSPLTNRQCREFLHLTSIPSTSKLLSRLNLPFSGKNKNRNYHNLY